MYMCKRAYKYIYVFVSVHIRAEGTNEHFFPCAYVHTCMYESVYDGDFAFVCTCLYVCVSVPMSVHIE